MSEDWRDFVRPLDEPLPETGRAFPFERLPWLPGREMPQCGQHISEMSETTNVEWRFSNGGKNFTSQYTVDPSYCSRRARFKGFGQCLCAIHAGKMALSILLGESLLEEE